MYFNIVQKPSYSIKTPKERKGNESADKDIKLHAHIQQLMNVFITQRLSKMGIKPLAMASPLGSLTTRPLGQSIFYALRFHTSRYTSHLHALTIHC